MAVASTPLMVKAKKAKRSDDVVTYTRLKFEDHAYIVKVVKDRGWPHTIASVTAELVSKGRAVEDVSV